MNCKIPTVALLLISLVFGLLVLIVSTVATFNYEYDVEDYADSVFVNQEEPENPTPINPVIPTNETQNNSTEEGNNPIGPDGQTRILRKHYFTDEKDFKDTKKDCKKGKKLLKASFSLCLIDNVIKISLVLTFIIIKGQNKCRMPIIFLMIFSLVLLICYVPIFGASLKIFKDFYKSMKDAKKAFEKQNLTFFGEVNDLYNEFKRSYKLLAVCIAFSVMSFPIILISLIAFICCYGEKSTEYEEGNVQTTTAAAANNPPPPDEIRDMGYNK